MKNCLCLYIKYVGPGNLLGSRVQIKTYDLKYERPVRTYRPWEDAGPNNALNQALVHIEKAGLNVIGYNGNAPSGYVVLCEWNHDALKELFD